MEASRLSVRDVCGCGNGCKFWHAKKLAFENYERAVSNLVAADRAWSAHVDAIVEEAA